MWRGADGAEPRGNGLHGRPIWAGLQGYESTDQGADEADSGKENSARHALDGRQHLHSRRSCGEHQNGQGAIHGHPVRED